MSYYLDLFSPETYESFSKSDRNISGFRIRHQNAASRIQVGDRLLCYMTKLSRWFGVLEIKSDWFKDETPIFYPTDDPFIIRFHVKPIVWLPKEKGIPIHDDRVWKKLSFTKDMEKGTSQWTGKFRTSLVEIEEIDGKFLEQLITSQEISDETFKIDEKEYTKWVTHRVKRIDKEVSVTVPQDIEIEVEKNIVTQSELRESLKVQASLAKIGSQMGHKIWIPRNNRSAVISEWKEGEHEILDRLPLNYDEATIKTIEQIDVLWLHGRSIIRAFEIEHTTSIYSGILRMADLLALQPNMNIHLHIVAPTSRKDKVFQELRRPIFSLLEEGALSEKCTYISYDSIQELFKQKHLAHLSDSVLDEYAEEAE